MSLVKLVVLAEERLLGLGLASLLSQRYETYTTKSYQRAAALLDTDHAKIALWLGDRLDADAVAQLALLERRDPQLRFCVLARAADPEALDAFLGRQRPAVAMLCRTEHLDVGEVVASVEEVLAGRSSLAPSAVARMMERGPDELDALACLTPFEHEVLELVAEGLRNCEIGRRLCKSEKAVEKRVSSVFHKLGLDTRAAGDCDRRVTAARIFFACRPQSMNGDAREGVLM
jgi:DNA-binding NarL/FixJ family response regulator